MKRLLITIAALLALPLLAHGQGAFYKAGPFPVPGLVYVCPVPAGGVPCAFPSLIYADQALTQPFNNPFTLQQGDAISFWVSPGQYTIQMPAYNSVQVVTIGTNSGGGGGGSVGIAGTVQVSNGSGGFAGSQPNFFADLTNGILAWTTSQGASGWQMSSNGSASRGFLQAGNNGDMVMDFGAIASETMTVQAPTMSFLGPSYLILGTLLAGQTFDVAANACLTKIVALGGGVCDATAISGTQTIAAQINIGTVPAVLKVSPYLSADINSITDGVSCGFRMFHEGVLEAETVGGVPGAQINISSGSANPYAMLCTDGTQGINTKVKGIRFRNTSKVPASNADVYISFTFDQSLFEDVGIGDSIGTPCGLFATKAADTTTFERLNVGMNNHANGVPICVASSTSNENQELIFRSITANNPGSGLPHIKITDSSAANACSVRFYGIYEEGNTSNTSYTANTIDGCRSVSIFGQTFKSEIASSTSPVWSISNTANTSVDVHGLWITGQPASQSQTAIVNNNSTSCPSTPCNRKTNGSGGIPEWHTVQVCSSSASPAVCSNAQQGAFNIATGTSSVQINTTMAPYDNSDISITFDTTLGTRLGVTCNTTAQQPYVSAITPGSNFTVSVPSNFTTNPGCYTFSLR